MWNMNEIVPGLWIGALSNALDVENLKSNGIHSILTAMRGRITIHESFTRHQIPVDDYEDEDILVHFLPSILFIQKELDKGRGVLVHCQAGVSRSSTIVAAYLMYSRDLSRDEALSVIRVSRPFIDPNDGFLRQLDVFQKARFEVSRRVKETRLYYLERAVEEVMNGDGSPPETTMFARFPPTDSTPATPAAVAPRRRIRCKKCRQELATREHMLDHGQLGPPTPQSLTPAGSRRPSMGVSQSGNPPATSPLGASRGISSNLTMSTIAPTETPPTTQLTSEPHQDNLDDVVFDIRRQTPEEITNIPERVGDFVKTEGKESLEDVVLDIRSQTPEETSKLMHPLIDRETTEKDEEEGAGGSSQSVGHAQILAARISNAIKVPPPSADGAIVEEASSDNPSTQMGASRMQSPSELMAELHNNPKLAGLRATPALMSAPILANPKCSGYFVEPMKWMEPFLSAGELSGKILCPNKKCGAKLGNYDWAGVPCGCKQWVTPGFCLNRSKVDEVV